MDNSPLESAGPHVVRKRKVGSSEIPDEVDVGGIGEQQAIVVGINRYDGSFAALGNAVADAQALAHLLKSDFAFILLPGGEPLLDATATREGLQEAISASLRSASPSTRWMFYFAGHGLVVDGQAYLVPFDAVFGEPDSYLPLQWVLDESLRSPCGEALVLLDACYAGQALIRPGDLSDLIPAEREDRRVRQIITSGNPDEPVLDGGGSGHSVFTQALLLALHGWAGIHMPGGAVHFSKLLDYLVFEIPVQLETMGIRRNLQKPVGGNLVGNRDHHDFIFQPVVSRLNADTVRGTRSRDARRRIENLARLAQEVEGDTGSRPLAAELALAHLQLPPDPTGPSAGRAEAEPDVRAQAARTLGALKVSGTFEGLSEALEDIPIVAEAAAGALASLGDTRAIQPLLAAVRSRSQELFLPLVRALALIDDENAWTGAMKESLNLGRIVPFIGPDFPASLTGVPDRIALVQALDKLSPLNELITVEAPGVAEAAARAMWGTSRLPYLEAIKRLFDHSDNEPGRLYQVLGRLPVTFWISGTYDDLLVKVLGGFPLIKGSEAAFAPAGRPLIVRLLGDLRQPRSLLVLESDYQTLRDAEADRRALVDCLQAALDQKVVLFLGYDPRSPDFALLVKHILNRHLASGRAQAFLVWPEDGPTHHWSNHPIRQISRDPVDILEILTVKG